MATRTETEHHQIKRRSGRSQKGRDGDEHKDERLGGWKRRRSIAAAEARDLSDLRYLASRAQVVEFDGCGRIARPSFLPAGTFDEVSGLIRIVLPPAVRSALSDVHRHIKLSVPHHRMVPWAGVGEDTSRLRCFGFLGKEALARLDDTGVKLHAPEKSGAHAVEDERANRAALCVLNGEWRDRAAAAAGDLIAELRPENNGVPGDIVNVEELVALQPNLHNGAAHLAAHLDWPRHEGFGKVIVTVAVRGGATILLIGGNCGANGEQPSWRFRLNEGECYVLSGKARNQCLHAVLVDQGDVERESLNLRFSLHTEEEAVSEVTRWWPDEI